MQHEAAFFSVESERSVALISTPVATENLKDVQEAFDLTLSSFAMAKRP